MISKSVFLESLIRVIVPSSDEDSLTSFINSVNRKPLKQQKQIKLFLTIIQLGTWIRFSKPFHKCPNSTKIKILNYLEFHKTPKIRLGFWGIRSLGLLSHYGHIHQGKKIGFTGPTQNNLPKLQERPVIPYGIQNKSLDPHHNLEFDILIIGSGAGGGVVANELIPLLKQGYKIAMVESGPHYLPKKFFNQKEQEMTSLYWDEGGTINQQGSLTIAAARTVGGSTNVYTGVTFDLPKEVFEKWKLGIPYEKFQQKLNHHRKKLHTHILPKEKINLNNQLFKEGAETLKWKVKELNISTQKCQGSGFCNMGCIHDAKSSTLNSYIPDALENGLTLISNCHIENISEGIANGTVFTPPLGSEPNKINPGKISIKAKKIVVAAGCIGTNALLSRSNLKNCANSLGRYITVHPAITVYGKFTKPVKGHLNFPKAYYVDDFSNSEHHILETAFYYPGVTAKNIEGWGKQHLKRMASYENFMCGIILNHDQAKPQNRIHYSKGQAIIDYKIDQDNIKALRLGQIRMAEIMFAAGCEEVYVPFAANGVIHKEDCNRIKEIISEENYLVSKTVFASAHPQGGCRMGPNEHDVCDTKGRLNNHKGIYVADASLFPTSSHVNPCLTVMALASMVTDTIKNDIALEERS